MFIYNGGTGVVTHCQIISNSAYRGGGVRFTSDAAGSYMQNCVIQFNTAGYEGGGVMIYHVGIVRNCLITDNVASNDGGGIDVDWGNGAYIEGCTIARNCAPNGGGLGYIISGATVKNSIVWGNSNANWDGGEYAYCCMAPAATGTGNFTNNPMFADSANGNFRLTVGSPCINAGINLAWTTNAADLDGNVRTMNSRVDIGAYEFDLSVVVPAVPVNVQASDGAYTNKVLLVWSAANGAAGYQIFRHTTSNAAASVLIGTLSSNSFDDTGVVANVTYYYWVKSTNVVGTSAFSSADIGYCGVTGVTAGLVGWWKLNETNGTSVADSSANGNTGAASTASWAAGPLEGCYRGVGNNYVQIGDANSLDISGSCQPMTIAAWVKLPSVAADSPTLITKRSGENRAFDLLYQSAEDKYTFNLYNGADGGGIRSSAALDDNTWHFLVGIRDTTMKFCRFRVLSGCPQHMVVFTGIP